MRTLESISSPELHSKAAPPEEVRPPPGELYFNRKRQMLTPDREPMSFMTTIPDRHPHQKLHRTIGQAHTAVSYRCNMWQGAECEMHVYEWKDGGGWTLKDTIPKGTPLDGLPWRQREVEKRKKRQELAKEREEKRLAQHISAEYTQWHEDNPSGTMLDAYMHAFRKGMEFS